MLCADLDLFPAHLILMSQASLDLRCKGLAPLPAAHNLGVGSGVLQEPLVVAAFLCRIPHCCTNLLRHGFGRQPCCKAELTLHVLCNAMGEVQVLAGMRQPFSRVGAREMFALIAVCSWNTNGIMILAWML